MIKVLLSPKIAYLVDRNNRATSLLIFSYRPFLYLLAHITVADAAKTMYGQVWDLRLSHLIVYKITREEGTITKCWADARFNDFQVAER